MDNRKPESTAQGVPAVESLGFSFNSPTNHNEILRLTEREYNLVMNCKTYAENNPAGMPGHNLAIIIAKMAKALGVFP